MTQRAACAQVPLGRRFDSVLEPEQRFSPQLVTEHLAKRGIEVTLLALLALSPLLLSQQRLLTRMTQVGLVLDLTNTWRYYDPNDWLARGIDHRKVTRTLRAQTAVRVGHR